MKDKIIIDGEEFVKANSLAETDGYMLDNFHIILHRKNIEIKGKKCFFCGEDFVGRIKDLTKHHAIPKRFKIPYNVFIPLCEPCHIRLDRNLNKKKKSTQNPPIK